jgi:hypothetical protein
LPPLRCFLAGPGCELTESLEASDQNSGALERGTMTRATQPPEVTAFLDGIEDTKRREDSRALLVLMQKVLPKEKPRLWPGNIVGVGEFHYRYASGREGVTVLLGFSPRKAALTLYLGPSLRRFESVLASLGKHTAGKGCVYLKRLADVDEGTLVRLLTEAVEYHRSLGRS